MADPKHVFILFFLFSLSFILNLEASVETKLSMAEGKKRYIIVSQEGSGNFKTIKDALQNISQPNKGRVVISIKPGIYREKIAIVKEIPFVALKAFDWNHPPKITWNDTSSSSGGSTLLSATVSVNSDYFIAMIIIFQNSAKHEHAVNGPQAVALQISGTKGAFYNCTFNGYQDTLYDRAGLHYFKNCSISGDIDFIFGNGQSLYEGCHLNYIGSFYGGTITAQKRTRDSLSTGYSFKNCKITGGLGNNSRAFLGRPWGNHSRVIFSYTFMDKVVIPDGWDDWSNPKTHKTVYYGEYKCSGPGSKATGRVPWARALTYEEVKPFLGRNFVEGEKWILDPSFY